MSLKPFYNKFSATQCVELLYVSTGGVVAERKLIP